MVRNRAKHHIFVVDRNIFAEPYFCTLTFSNILYRYYHSYTKRYAQAVSYNSLQYLQKHCVVGLQRHITLKNGEIHYRIYLFAEDFEVMLSLIWSNFFDESPESTSWITEGSSEMKTEDPETHLWMKSSRTQNKNTKKDLQAFNYKVILLKSKLTNIIQLGKEKNQITEFS